jgi:hypothetical protein
VLKAVAPNPDLRYQSAVTFAAELRSMLAILDVRGVAGEEEDEHAGPSANIGRIVVLTIVIALLLGGLIWWFA